LLFLLLDVLVLACTPGRLTLCLSGAKLLTFLAILYSVINSVLLVSSGAFDLLSIPASLLV